MHHVAKRAGGFLNAMIDRIEAFHLTPRKA
jgi:hypothetical protein